LGAKLVWRPKKKSSGKRVSFANPLVVYLGEPQRTRADAASGIFMQRLSVPLFSCDPMLDEVRCCVAVSEAQSIRAAKIMQMLHAAGDREYFTVSSPMLGGNSTGIEEGEEQVPQMEIRQNDSITSPVAVTEVNNNLGIEEFLVSITKPISAPLLFEPLSSTCLREHPLDTSPAPICYTSTSDLNTLAHAEETGLAASNVSPGPDSVNPTNHNLGSPSIPNQRRSSRLAKKAKSRTGKWSIQIAEDLLVKKLNALSPCKYLTELDVVEQLAQHFDRPLTKGKAEAIDVLANHAKQGTKKKKRQSGGTVAPARRRRWWRWPDAPAQVLSAPLCCFNVSSEC